MAHPTDVTVGGRIRELRIRKGISQQVLGQQVGISFQQIQKYERGTNRMGSSRLVQIADVLDVSPASLLEGLGRNCSSLAAPSGPLYDRASKVARDWQRIENERLRDQTAIMLHALALDQGG